MHWTDVYNAYAAIIYIAGPPDEVTNIASRSGNEEFPRSVRYVASTANRIGTIARQNDPLIVSNIAKT